MGTLEVKCVRNNRIFVLLEDFGACSTDLPTGGLEKPV